MYICMYTLTYTCLYVFERLCVEHFLTKLATVEKNVSSLYILPQRAVADTFDIIDRVALAI